MIDWPLSESRDSPLPNSAEAALQSEGADWGPAARAILGPHLRYFAAIPDAGTPQAADRQWRQFGGGAA